ncbi:MAG TPA: O-antigen ligase family protein [Bryobacteraceae bacterium]
MAVSLASAALFTGGVYPTSWEWIAVAASAGSLLTLIPPSTCPREKMGSILILCLAGWILLFIVPLPAGLVAEVFPSRWHAAQAADQITGRRAVNWLGLSLAPAATWERLLDVLPCLAVLAAGREMGWRWRDRIWLPAIPVIVVAVSESILGLVQFGMMRAAGGDVASATGTYVNRNHFAGLLEMAFPLAVAGAFAAWKRRAVWQSTGLLVAAGCLLGGVVVSLSRMGFAATIAAAVVVTPILLWPKGFRWSVLVPVVAVAGLIVLLPTKELKQRFFYMAANEEVNTDIRVAIWRDTVPMIAAHPWTGTGLGAYERGLYAFKTAKPTNTVDFAHNDYLQILAELGIVGIALAAGLAVWILRGPLRIALRHPGARNWELAVGLSGSLLAIGIHSLTDFNLYIPANAMVLAWLAGLAMSPGLWETANRGELTCV